MGSLRESMTGETTMREVVEKELGEEVVVVAALIKLVSPRASKKLPKRFILAVTVDRVVALKGTPISDEDGDDIGAHIRGVIDSWDRAEVSATRAAEGDGGTLQIPGASIPVFDRSIGNPRERELFMALGA